MDSLARRVAHRYLSAAITVKVDPERTEKGRQQFKLKNLLIGEFASPINLYRIFDGEELRKIVRGGEISGGTYSIEGERAFGASWGADKAQVIKWGEAQRGGRLGHELFLAEIQGQGRQFSHMHLINLDIAQPTVTIPEDACSTGMGCSLKVRASDVDQWSIVEPGGHLVPVQWSDLVEQAKGVGLKPRKQELWLGALMRPTKRLAAYFISELLGRRLSRIQDDNERWKVQQMTRQIKRVGAPRGWPASALREACAEGVDCGAWTNSFGHAEARAHAERSDGEKTFAVLFLGVATIAAPEHDVTPESIDLKRVLVYDPDSRDWEQLFSGSSPKKLKVVVDEGGRARIQ